MVSLLTLILRGQRPFRLWPRRICHPNRIAECGLVVLRYLPCCNVRSSFTTLFEDQKALIHVDRSIYPTIRAYALLMTKEDFSLAIDALTDFGSSQTSKFCVSRLCVHHGAPCSVLMDQHFLRSIARGCPETLKVRTNEAPSLEWPLDCKCLRILLRPHVTHNTFLVVVHLQRKPQWSRHIQRRAYHLIAHSPDPIPIPSRNSHLLLL